MHFKRIELYGFKSFADKTILDFEPGITAIVGPNGCGKSNVADSIKWVLGEQSAKMLRGSKMEDVIFNGTDTKEPINFAEVSLTLDNRDRLLPIEYDEVTVTRRLYRSGESEYILNKIPVRLKDVNELFMGTGIGTSAYSLIEQGRIDQILSSKPEDRREVFEEASGITKYKSKKREALRRLEDTEQNLLRINDIILEVKRQITSIERQARKAERYKESYEELKALELKLTRINLEKLKLNLESNSVDLDSIKKKESDLDSELNNIRNELQSLNLKRSGIESKKMEHKSSLISVEGEISTSRDKISMNKERVEELKKKRVELEQEIEKNKDALTTQEKELLSLKEKLMALESGSLERANLLSEKEKRLNELEKAILDNEMVISTSKANIIDIASKESKLRNQATKVSNELATHEARIKRLGIEKETIEEEKHTIDAKLAEVSKEENIISGDLLSIKSKKESLLSSSNEITGLIDKITDELANAHKSITINRSRLEVLEEAKAKYEGFSSGVKAILKKDGYGNKCIAGVNDVLANLLSVERGYEASIEACLGDYLQAIVVDNEEAMDKGIEYLKHNASGRATFIYPRYFANIRPDSLDIDLEDYRVLGKAMDFVKIEEPYNTILKVLLKNIFIVKDIKSAKEILNEKNSLKGAGFVTLSGEIVSSGFVSGGDISQERLTLVNRDAKIQELLLKIKDEEMLSNKMSQDRRSYEANRAQIEEDIGALARSIGEKEILFANIKTSRSHIEEDLKTVLDEISLVTLEFTEVNAEIARLKDEEVSIKNSLLEAQNNTKINNERVLSSEAKISDHAKEKERLLIETAEQRTELNSLETKKEGLSSTLKLLESSFGDLGMSLETRSNEVSASIIKIDELTKEISVLEARIEELTSRRSVDAEELGKIESVYTELVANISDMEELYKTQEKALIELRSASHDVDLKKVETSYNIDNLSQRIKDVYKMDLNEVALPELWQDVALELLKQEVEEKRSKLDAMGTVNLVAIEEHTELQERFTFLTNQRDDLLKAKDSLLKAIDKINKTTKDLFVETFKNIQVEFRNFFKLLFGGGEGELILIDESNVLESGIEIVARPPGKRLQNVSLLSGGEKALTAISLIFAIFKVRPSPFCVLDEIDAPLDESNVGRFSRSLDMFTHTSQFIVITHNKKTMDMADVMYGITMEQSGMSKVVSVKFSDTNKVKPADVVA